MKSIYLDHAAATPLDPSVLEAMRPFLTEEFYNSSAAYDGARSVRQSVNQARAIVAGYLGAKPSEVVFTAGGTEANNMAIHGVMQEHQTGTVIVSSIEHDSVLLPAQNYDHKIALVKGDGRLDVDALGSMIDDRTVLISVQYANNEIGVVQPIKDIAQLMASIKVDRAKAGNKRPLYLHVDACQAPAYLALHVSRLGVDMMTINAGKIYGPKQTGALFVRSGVVLRPIMQGGGQERGLRSGTENVANIAGFARALQLVQERRSEEVERLKTIQIEFVGLLKEYIPSAVINGSMKHRLPNNVHVTFPGQDNERLMMELDQRGIQCAVGSACSASSEEPSHVLMALGISRADAQASLRFSMGKDTTKEDIQAAVQALREVIRSM